MINVAGHMFIEYEKEIDGSHQMRKNYENYIGDDKIKSVVLNKVHQNNEIQSEIDNVYKINQVEGFSKSQLLINENYNYNEMKVFKHFIKSSVINTLFLKHSNWYIASFAKLITIYDSIYNVN